MMRFVSTIVACLFTVNAFAFSIKPWFQNVNQRAMTLYNNEQYDKAEQQFSNLDWKAAAAYRAGQYDKASEQFKVLNTADGFYNQGNALAFQGNFKAAIKAYDKTLSIIPTHEDARFNRDLLKKILEQQRNQQDQDNNDQDDQDEESKQDQDNNDQEKQNNSEDKQSEQNAEPNEEQQDKAEPKEKEKQKQAKDEKEEQKAQAEPKKSDNTPSDAEKKQALRLVPDDPGGLLREKFWRDHWRRLQKEQR